MERYDILIIGGGAAGIAAAKAAHASGCRSILLADRGEDLGGILRQCLHRGFGPGLNGPEYIAQLAADFPGEVTLWSGATVLQLHPDRTARIIGPEIGDRTVAFRQAILATGCREVPIGALPIAGTRPRGIYTAGEMQERINLHGQLPQGPAVILGSGDLGLILAEHLAQAGLSVTLVEQRPHCGGMARNQLCLQRENIRLLCGVTVEEVFGAEELEGVLLSDGAWLPCRTLLTAVGLRPDQELLHGLGNPPWLHLCGNCRKVHPMVESVIREATQAGQIWAAGRDRK